MRDDPIMMGAVAGLIANILKAVGSWSFHLMGWLQYTTSHIGAGYFVGLEFINEPVALAIGIIVDFTIAAFLGVILYQLLKFSGRDYAIWKGVGLSLFFYISLAGISLSADLTRVTLLTPLPNLMLIITHIIFGVTAGWILGRYAEFRV